MDSGGSRMRPARSGASKLSRDKSARPIQRLGETPSSPVCAAAGAVGGRVGTGLRPARAPPRLGAGVARLRGGVGAGAAVLPGFRARLYGAGGTDPRSRCRGRRLAGRRGWRSRRGRRAAAPRRLPAGTRAPRRARVGAGPSRAVRGGAEAGGRAPRQVRRERGPDVLPGGRGGGREAGRVKPTPPSAWGCARGPRGRARPASDGSGASRPAQGPRGGQTPPPTAGTVAGLRLRKAPVAPDLVARRGTRDTPTGRSGDAAAPGPRGEASCCVAPSPGDRRRDPGAAGCAGGRGGSRGAGGASLWPLGPADGAAPEAKPSALPCAVP